MELLIISILLIAFSVFCFYKDSETFDMHWIVLASISLLPGGLIFLLSFIGLITVKYDYRIAESNQQSLQITLNQSRETASDYERAMITKEIADFNSYVMRKRAQNKFMLLDDFIDDRFDSLKLVK